MHRNYKTKSNLIKLIIILVSFVLFYSLIMYTWVSFDCMMRNEYAKEHLGYSFSKEQCLKKRKQEGHWY